MIGSDAGVGAARSPPSWARGASWIIDSTNRTGPAAVQAGVPAGAARRMPVTLVPVFLAALPSISDGLETPVRGRRLGAAVGGGRRRREHGGNGAAGARRRHRAALVADGDCRRRAARPARRCRSSCARARCADDPTSTPSPRVTSSCGAATSSSAPTVSATTRSTTWRGRSATSASTRTATSTPVPSCSSSSSASKASSRARPISSDAPAPAARRDRIDFIDDQRAVATNATYTSCGIDGSGAPVWVLSAGSVALDLEANEGIATNGVLRFYGVPILAAPVLSFPLSEARKSGWLPPSFGHRQQERRPGRGAVLLEHRAEPRRDADAVAEPAARRRRSTPSSATSSRRSRARRTCNLLPYDALARRSRYSLRAFHEGSSRRRRAAAAARAARLRRRLLEGISARDHQPHAAAARLGPASTRRPFGDWTAYARVQALAGAADDGSEQPHRTRPTSALPQLGARYAGPLGARHRRRASRPSSTASSRRRTSRCSAQQDRHAPAFAGQHQPAVRRARAGR